MCKEKTFEELVMERVVKSEEVPDTMYPYNTDGHSRYKLLREYDSSGNLIHFKSNNDEKWYEYDSNGNIIHLKSCNNNEYFYEYDSNNNMVHFKDSYGYEGWNEYDSNNNLIHFKDSNNAEYRAEYDSNNNLIHRNDTNGNEEWIEYNENNNLIHYRNSNGEEKYYSINGNEITKEEYEKIYNIHNGEKCILFVAVKLKDKNNVSDVTELLAMNGNTFDTNGEDTIFIHINELKWLLHNLDIRKIDYEIQ